jgi:hypothetical protein
MECEDWWIITDPSTYTLNRLSSFYKDTQIIKEIILAQKLETIGIALIQFLNFDFGNETPSYPFLKSIGYYIHQN